MENYRTIEDIAYLMKNAKNKPIVLLGAGASVSAGIPLVGEIIDDILEIHKEKPSIKRLRVEQRKDYYKIMSALSAQERRSLFSKYINDAQVKLNVTHIYLAQMLKQGLIDYILTVNFDDLMLKACAMFNFIPPVYDVSILNDFTTTTFLEQSVTYLHGQHHGQWLLNAEGELKKIKEAVPKIFERICNNRTWIVIGYSGEDEVLDEIAKIGSFENELYWVGYNDNPVSHKVQEKLFSSPRTNAYHIQGYDSDSFFLKLHSELGLQTPEIFNKPFSFLKTMLEKVRDIQIDKNSEHKSLFEGIQERMEISKKQVIEAIDIIENKESEEQLIQRIIEKAIKHDFSIKDAIIFENEIEKNKYHKAKNALGNYFGEWGNKDAIKFRLNKNEDDLKSAVEKLRNAINLNPTNSFIYSNLAVTLLDLIILSGEPYSFDEVLGLFEKAVNLNTNYIIYCNWGTTLTQIGRVTKNEKYLKESLSKFKKSIELNPDFIEIYCKWAYSLEILSKIANDKERLIESISMYKKALKFDEKNAQILNNLGSAIKDLATLENDEKVYEESIDIFKYALKVIPENEDIYYNLGVALFDYAEIKNDIKLFEESLKNFKKAIEINPKSYDGYNNCGIAYAIIAKNENKISLFERSFNYFKNAIKIDSQNSKAFFNWGNAIMLLAEKQKNKFLFFESIEMYKQALILDPKDDEVYCQLGRAQLNVGIINENELNFWDSFMNFQKALELNPNHANALYSWGLGLLRYSYLIKEEEDRKLVLIEALEKTERSYWLGADPYNLSCIYSMLGDKENALKYLTETLEKRSIQLEFVYDDRDWNNYKNDPDFINLLNIYKENS